MAVIFRKNVLKRRSSTGDIPYPLPNGVGVTAVVEGFVGPSNVPFHQHDDEEHYWFVLEGSGRVQIGDEEFDVESGDLVITPPGVHHRIWTEPSTIGDTARNIRLLEWAIKRS